MKKDSQLEVCFLIPDFPICTGANTQALTLALELKKLGVQPIMVFSLNKIYNLQYPCYDKSYEQKLQDAGIPVYKKPDEMGDRWKSYKFYLKLFWRIRNDFQIIYINGTSPMICWFILFFKLLGKKIIIKMTGKGINDPITLLKAPEFNWFLLKLLSLSDKFLGTSSALCDAYRESSLLPDSKLVQIPNGVNTELFAPIKNEDKKREIKKQLGLPAEDKIVTYVGSVRRGKGVDLLITCWESVVKQYPNATLIIIGPLCPMCPTVRKHDKEFVDLLKRKVGMYLLKDKDVLKLLLLTKSKYKIDILGTKSDIFKYLQASDIFTFLSRNEGMPNALMEAMSVGLPCITLNIDEISGDLITHDEVGHTIADENLEHLTQGIVDLLNNDEKRAKMGATARKKILAEYKIEDIAHQHYSLYKELL